MRLPNSQNNFGFAFVPNYVGQLTLPNVFNPTFSTNVNNNLPELPNEIIPNQNENESAYVNNPNESSIYDDLFGISQDIMLLTRKILIGFLATVLIALGIYLLAKDSAGKLIPAIPLEK